MSMALLLSSAIAGLAERFGGLVLLELPDELPTSFLAEVISVANSRVQADPLFASLLFDRRTDISSAGPSCGFRELAELRQDQHLVVCFAGDNRGMSTYTTTYAPLFGPEFPSPPGSEAVTSGIAALDDLAMELARCIESEIDSELFGEQLVEAVQSVLGLLADSYRKEGNTAFSWVSRWWLHVAQWADEFVEATKAPHKTRFGTDVLRLLFGAAGLPSPDSGTTYKLPIRRDYAAVIHDRWNSVGSIQDELARLARRQDGTDAAARLQRIAWSSELLGSLGGAGSLVQSITLAGSKTSSVDRRVGWAQVSESAFLDKRISSAQLIILRDGRPLPEPWPGAPVLRPHTDEVESGRPALVDVRNLKIVLPYLDSVLPTTTTPAIVELRNELTAYVTPGVVESFNPIEVCLTDVGLEVDVSLRFQIPNWTPRRIRLSVSVRGRLADLIGAEVSTRVFLLGPDAVLMLYRRSDMKGRGIRTLSAQVLPRLNDKEPEDVQLEHGGLYESAIAIGAEAFDEISKIRLEPTREDSVFRALDSASWLLTQSEPCPLESGDSIECDTGALFTFQLKTLGERPLSPLSAACIGNRPSVESRGDLNEKCFGQLERVILDALRQIEVDASTRTLGHVLLTTSESRFDIDLAEEGYYRSRALKAGQSQRYPSPPSSDLIAHPRYAELIDAYRELALSSWVARAEQEENSHGLLLSRVSLRNIKREKVDGLLSRYADLVSAADALSKPSDGFWARFPMSVVAYPEARTQVNSEAVFLSPAHPIRLAWLWQLENAFAVVREETGDVPAFARLSEGWTYPWVSGVRARIGSDAMAFISVPCDSGPEHVFVGWSALVCTHTTDALELRAPQVVNGFRFPAGASSGLTESAVEGALRAFVRVFPQVRTLLVELPASQEVQRSVGVDTALGDAFRRLTTGDDALACLPGGMRVRDSLLRLGPIPARDEFVHRDRVLHGRRKIEWERFRPDSHVSSEDRVHIRLAETQTSRLSVASLGSRRAAFPRVPLRRFPRRSRHEDGIVIDPSFHEESPVSRFASAVAACESVPGKPPFALFVSPGTSFEDLSSADWTVTGDAGLDPAVLQRIAVGNASRHMLWEWRPAIATSGAGQLEQRPFVTISRVPEAFSASLRDKVKLLLRPEQHSQLSTWLDRVIGLLAQRGIGLNSLLAMGHHHATGALGFFFALRVLSQWASAQTSGEVRLIVPVDAVDSFLRAVAKPTTRPIDTRKLADLLVLSCVCEDNKTVVRVVPVEVKHYGLVSDENAELFPEPGEARIEKHIKQLTDYIALLGNIQRLREEASETHGSLIDTAIGAVIDAAILLDPELQGGDDPAVLRHLSRGAMDLQVCPGVLFWFQKGGASSEAESAYWKIAEDSPALHCKAFVDPLACWREIWFDETGRANRAVAESLAWSLANRAQIVDQTTDQGRLEADVHKQAGGTRPTTTPAPAVASAIVQPLTIIDTIAGKAETPTLSNTAEPELPREPTGSASLNISLSEKTALVHQEAQERQLAHRGRGLSRDDLERRYRVILKTFQEFRVQVHPPESQGDRFTEGPASIVFGIRPGFGVAVGRIESQVENLKLRLQLDDKAQIDCKVHRGLVLLDVPKADNERYFVDADDMWSRWTRPPSGFSSPIGEDRYGNIVAIDWADSNSPHLLLAGQTGSGKSVALMSILAGAVHFYSSSELRLVLVDPKRVELTTFDGSAYLLTGQILTQAPHAAEALEKAVAEMEERYSDFAKAGKGITNLDAYNRIVAYRKPRWLIVLDEYADLTHDPAAKTAIESSLTRLAQKARAAGIHVLVSTQKPIVDVISTVVRGNLPAQLALRVRSATESHVILDEGGAEKLTGKGDALLKIGGSVTRLQCASYQLQ